MYVYIFNIFLELLGALLSLEHKFIFYQPPEKIDKVMRGPFYMDSLKAKEFGVIDKVLLFLRSSNLYCFAVFGISEVQAVLVFYCLVSHINLFVAQCSHETHDLFCCTPMVAC
jgi:hypothetical protein